MVWVLPVYAINKSIAVQSCFFIIYFLETGR